MTVVAIPFIAIIIVFSALFFYLLFFNVRLDDRPLTEDEIEEQINYLKEWKEKQEAKKMIIRKDGINQENTVDMVNHPSHYANSCSFECIDMMEMVFGPEAMSWYCLINAFKYMWRWKNKNGIEDLDKADWYLNKYNELFNAPTAGMKKAYSYLSGIMPKFREEINNDKG
jgi:hypothetical protein